LAADLGTAHPDVLERNAGVVRFQDLDELAVTEGDVGGFAVEVPVAPGQYSEDEEDSESAGEPGTTTVFASFLYQGVLRSGGVSGGGGRTESDAASISETSLPSV